MKIVIAMDSFKGSIGSLKAASAVAEGAKRVYPDADVTISPLADGGEGSAEAIISANRGVIKRVPLKDPLGREITAAYGFLPQKNTAVIEMAAAAGLTLIDEKERNPLKTTTFGVGEMIKHAINCGIRNFIIGIGGSATNDGGIGMLSALGFRFLDSEGNVLRFGAEELAKICEIKADNVLPQLSCCSFLIACDVQNPLCGVNGCSAVYGPQKGADAATVEFMDKAMERFEALTRTYNPNADGSIPGSGAAGGLGFAFMSYLGGVLKSGIELVISQTGLEEKIKTADIVVTGEGRLDGQSAMGKAPIGVAKIAKKYGKRVIAFSGCVTEDARGCNSLGIDAFFPILKAPCSLEEAMDSKTAEKNLADMAEQVFRLIKAGV